MASPRQAGQQVDVESDGAEVDSGMVQHAAALAMAEAGRRHNAKEVQLLAQDPGYTDDTKDLLTRFRSKIVGDSAAGGFVEVDDGFIVSCAYVSAPVMEIVADLTRPAVFISIFGHYPPFSSRE